MASQEDQINPTWPGQCAPIGQRVLVSTLWVLVGRVGSIAGLFATNVLLSHRLDDAAFSLYLSASFLVPFFALLTNLGTPEILMRDVRACLVRGDMPRARRLVAACLAVCFVGSLVIGAILIGALRCLSFEAAHWRLFQTHAGWIALWILTQSMCQVAGESFRGCDRFSLSTAIYTKSGGWLVNMLSAGLVIALWPDARPVDFGSVMAAQVIATALPAAFGLAALFRLLSRPIDGPLPTPTAAELPEPTIRWLLRESWPIFVSYGVIIGIEQLDIFVVWMLCRDRDVADYGVAKRWLSLVNFAFVTLAPAITPFIAELHQRGEIAKLKRLMRGAATIVALPTIVICVLLVFGAPLAIDATFGPQRLGAVAPLRCLLVSQVLLSLAGHSYVALSMTGHQRPLMRTSLVVGVLYLLLGPAAIAMWGILGAALAKSFATTARAIAAAALVHRHLGFWSTASLAPSALWEACRLLYERLGRLKARRRSATRPQSAPIDPTS